MRILVVITSVALLIGFGGNSFADEEDEFTVSMTSGDETYYSDSGSITHTAKIETSHVFAEVDWYVNDVWQTTSKGDGAKKTASFTKGLSGNGYGRSYEIKAVAYSEGGETDSDSHRIRVKKNVVSYRGGSENDYGYAENAKCEWSGTTASSEQSISVHNFTSNSVSVTYRFWFSVVRTDSAGAWQADIIDAPKGEVKDNIEVRAGKSYSVCRIYSYTLPPLDHDDEKEAWWNEGDKARLEIETTVDVTGQPKRTALASNDEFRFPRPE